MNNYVNTRLVLPTIQTTQNEFTITKVKEKQQILKGWNYWLFGIFIWKWFKQYINY